MVQQRIVFAALLIPALSLASLAAQQPAVQAPPPPPPPVPAAASRKPHATGHKTMLSGNPNSKVRVNLDLGSYTCMEGAPTESKPRRARTMRPRVRHAPYHYATMVQRDALAKGYRPRRGQYCF